MNKVREGFHELNKRQKELNTEQEELNKAKQTADAEVRTAWRNIEQLRARIFLKEWDEERPWFNEVGKRFVREVEVRSIGQNSCVPNQCSCHKSDNK